MFHKKIDDSQLPAFKVVEKFFLPAAMLSQALDTLTTLVSEELTASDQHLISATINLLKDIFNERQKIVSNEKKISLKELLHDLIDRSKQLTPAEKSKLALIVSSRLDYSESDRKEALNTLKTYTGSIIYNFAQASGSFSTFCEESSELAMHWANSLKKKNETISESNSDEQLHIYFVLTSPDKKTTIPVFSQFVAPYVLTKFEESKKMDNKIYDIDLLSSACELGLYSALNFRCMINQTKLSEENIPIEKIESEILYDVKMLTAYHSIGYYRAGQILLALGDYFALHDNPSTANKYYFMSMEFFCDAYLLEDSEVSKKLIRILNNNKSLPDEAENLIAILPGTGLDEDSYGEIKKTRYEALNPQGLRL